MEAGDRVGVFATNSVECVEAIFGAYQSYHAGAIGSGRNTVIDYFEKNWKENLTLNAAMKLGLEALRNANDQELNRDAVEVSVIDSDGYRILDRDEVNKQIDRLKPLEE